MLLKWMSLLCVACCIMRVEGESFFYTYKFLESEPVDKDDYMSLLFLHGLDDINCNDVNALKPYYKAQTFLFRVPDYAYCGEVKKETEVVLWKLENDWSEVPLTEEDKFILFALKELDKEENGDLFWQVHRILLIVTSGNEIETLPQEIQTIAKEIEDRWTSEEWKEKKVLDRIFSTAEWPVVTEEALNLFSSLYKKWQTKTPALMDNMPKEMTLRPEDIVGKARMRMFEHHTGLILHTAYRWVTAVVPLKRGNFNGKGATLNFSGWKRAVSNTEIGAFKEEVRLLVTDTASAGYLKAVTPQYGKSFTQMDEMEYTELLKLMEFNAFDNIPSGSDLCSLLDLGTGKKTHNEEYNIHTITCSPKGNRSKNYTTVAKLRRNKKDSNENYLIFEHIPRVKKYIWNVVSTIKRNGKIEVLKRDIKWYLRHAAETK